MRTVKTSHNIAWTYLKICSFAEEDNSFIVTDTDSLKQPTSPFLNYIRVSSGFSGAEGKVQEVVFSVEGPCNHQEEYFSLPVQSEVAKCYVRD